MTYELRERITVVTRRFETLEQAQEYWATADAKGANPEAYFAPGAYPVQIVDAETGEDAKDHRGYDMFAA